MTLTTIQHIITLVLYHTWFISRYKGDVNIDCY
jgi:hypothetical protein